MKINLLPIILYLCSFTITKAQNRDYFFAIRSGYLLSSNDIKQAPGSLLLKPNIESKSGFYAAISYTKRISKLFSTRSDINYQTKGMIMERLNFGEIEKIAETYNYLGFSPTIGVNVRKDIKLFIGPEINFLVKKPNNEQDAKAVEFGILAQGNYQYRKLLFDVSFFKSISYFSVMNKMNPTFKFYNQNFRIGIGYIF